jgi:hypothetical protein
MGLNYLTKEESEMDLDAALLQLAIGLQSCKTKRDAMNLLHDAVELGRRIEHQKAKQSYKLTQLIEYKSALVDMVSQFAYPAEKNHKRVIHAGGLSALETAFKALNLPNPCPLKRFEQLEKELRKCRM